MSPLPPLPLSRPYPYPSDARTKKADEHVLTPLLFRLTKQTELPILLVGGRVVGAPKEVKALAASGALKQLVADAGGVVDGARKKKAKKL